jgi:hypothetical protein
MYMYTRASKDKDAHVHVLFSALAIDGVSGSRTYQRLYLRKKPSFAFKLEAGWTPKSLERRGLDLAKPINVPVAMRIQCLWVELLCRFVSSFQSDGVN